MTVENWKKSQAFQQQIDDKAEKRREARRKKK